MMRGWKDPSHLASPSEVMATGEHQCLWGYADSRISSSFIHKLLMVITGFLLPWCLWGVWCHGNAQQGKTSQHACLDTQNPIFLVFLQPGMCLQEPLHKPQTLMSREETREISPIPYI